MTTYARIVGGKAVDCRVHASATELAACFHPKWLAANPFVAVPDGTEHGATDNGDGTFTNPAAQPPVSLDMVLGRKEARDHVVQALGGNGVGTAKLQYYIDVAAANTATTTAAQNMRYALQALRTDETLTKSEAASIMTAMQFASGDRSTVLNSWPVQVF